MVEKRIEEVKEKEELNEEVKDSKAKKVLSKVKKHGKKLAVAAGAGVLLAVGYIAGKAKGNGSDIDSDVSLDDEFEGFVNDSSDEL